MFTVSELLSRNIRVNFLEDMNSPNLTQVVSDAVSKNTRTIPDLNTFGQGAPNANTGIIDWLFNFGATLAKWSFKALKWLGVTVSSAYQWLVSTITKIWNFDWNKTDEQMTNALAAYNVQIAGLWGGVMGKGGGTLAAISFGAGVGLIFPVIGGPALSAYLAYEVADEIGADFIDELFDAIGQTVNLWATQGMVLAYITTRKWIKRIPKSTLDQLVGTANSDWIRNTWGEPTAPSLSFSGDQEQAIEDIDSKTLQAFVENLIEEGWDTFVEGGAIVAARLDQVIASYEDAINAVNGPDRSIVIYPDQNSEEEFLVLEDIPQEQLIQTTQTLINTHRVIGNRSVGNIVASDFDEAQVSKPRLRKLTIEFSSRPMPPWIHDDGKIAKRYHVSIPDIKVGTTWNQVKKAAKFYTWGAFRAVARLANKRSMVVHADTQANAIAKLQEFLDLTDTEVQSIMCTEEVETPLKAKKMPTLIYPKSAKLMYRKNSLDNDGNVVIDGQYFDTEYDDWVLWTEEPLEPNLVIQ